MSMDSQDRMPTVNFANVPALAADLCGMPMAIVTVCRNGNVHMESQHGLSGLPVTVFCEYAILQDGLLEVTDATLDPRFRDLPQVRGAPFIRFYVGAPLISPTGQRLGTLALLDSQPRTIDDVQRMHLQSMANQMVVYLDLLRQHTQLDQLATELERVNRQLREQADHLRQAQHIARVGSWKYVVSENYLFLSDEILYMYGLTPAEFGETMEAFINLVHPEDRQAVRSAQETAMKYGNASVQCRVMRKDGKIRYFEIIGQLFCDKNGQEYLAGTSQDITEQKVAEHRIGQLAYLDQLTGLPNRKFVLDRIDRLVAMHHRTKQDAAVLFIDLDNFKALNDTHGHDKGDMLLKQVANRLQTCVRHYDCVGRFGGDEFVIVLERIGTGSINEAAHACQVAQKILSLLNEPYLLETLQHRITPSIGIAIFDSEMVSTSDLLRRADMAMYKAKAEGRNAIRFFSAGMQEAVNARSQLEADLRQGLVAQEFYLAYQPQVDNTGHIIGVEALLRWQHPKQGLVMPAQFIPMAEELGLIAEIGKWLLEQACQQLVRWTNDPPTQHLTLSVNVSVRQFRHAAFIDQTTETLSRTGADPKKLKIEITESMLISDIEETTRKMMALKAIGVRFALDDFGTGFSSLAYLQKLPLDELKIDQSFIQNVTTDKNNAAITRSIIGLAHNLGLSVIAEGVETEDQRQFLVDEGCASFQGFLYHKPLAAQTIETFMRDDSRPH
jgi:diguanylate cyclase (GGDEF)-like protein/PAS domain S-box-containing protein